ncbi:hypothetical protein RSW15_25110, partial [Escherichia coli]|uniref:hypothetical protein n=1 Tax=Escherichia coli TaxID=562 RepID=UPI0028DEACB4
DSARVSANSLLYCVIARHQKVLHIDDRRQMIAIKGQTRAHTQVRAISRFIVSPLVSVTSWLGLITAVVLMILGPTIW